MPAAGDNHGDNNIAMSALRSEGSSGGFSVGSSVGSVENISTPRQSGTFTGACTCCQPHPHSQLVKHGYCGSDMAIRLRMMPHVMPSPCLSLRCLWRAVDMSNGELALMASIDVR